ncbi:RNA-binding S4 domain-containing protein [Bordetella genomosp. 13]|uniref:RNA-binding S4 domain-containing protein n=1 Tax=Bordetella genomosp. 13 TaxID=463040 RepID=UPI00119E120B|nr:RNA-binding S4 domain-containing protein [Bordetella genomosp. 13]
MSTSHPKGPAPAHDKLRLDKWLWAARFYKTRSLAAQEVEKGRVLVNGQGAKPAREVRAGDRIVVRRQEHDMEVEVRGLSAVRGPAPVAALLYEETPDSQASRQRAAEQRRLAPEPAQTISDGRPTKRDRRRLSQWRDGG